MVPVVIVSPYQGANPSEVKRNLTYVNRCILDCLYSHGEAPFAVHAIYAEALNNTDPEQRKLALQAGDEWAKLAVRLVVYTDYGFTEGMNETINKSGKPCLHRTIGQNPSGTPMPAKKEPK